MSCTWEKRQSTELQRHTRCSRDRVRAWHVCGGITHAAQASGAFTLRYYYYPYSEGSVLLDPTVLLGSAGSTAVRQGEGFCGHETNAPSILRQTRRVSRFGVGCESQP